MDETLCRWTVTERSHGRCEACQCCRGESFQHRVKKGQGGLWQPSNGVRLCGSGTTGCHGDIEAHPLIGYLLGIGLESHQNPLTEPAYLHTINGTGWWLLDDEGCMTWVDPMDVLEPSFAAAIAWDRRPGHSSGSLSRPNPSPKAR